MEAKIFNIKGQETGKTIMLNDEVFGIEPNEHSVYLDVKQYLANKRQGTSKTKTRSEIAGSTRKLKKQKGSGGARVGDIKSPLLRGGGRIFGPEPRDYTIKLNKKLKKIAKKSVLSDKAKNNNIIVIEDFSIELPRTKSIEEIKKSFNILNEKVLLLINENDKNIYLSVKNLQKTSVKEVENCCTYEIMNSNKIIITEKSVEKLNKIL